MALIWWCRKKRWEFFRAADVAVTAASWFLVFLRLGDFLGGGYYGRPTTVFWGVRFPGLAERRHPLQLYELLVFLALAVGLLKLEKEYRTFEWYKDKRGEARSGFLTTVWLAVVGLTKLVVETWAEGGLYWMGLRLNQWVALFSFLTAGLLLAWRSGNLEWWERWLNRERKKKVGRRFKAGQDVGGEL